MNLPKVNKSQKSWEPWELDFIEESDRNGRSTKEIADELGRSYWAVCQTRSRIKLGKITSIKERQKKLAKKPASGNLRFDIDPDLHSRFMQMCVDKRRSFTSVFAEIVRDAVETHEATR